MTTRSTHTMICDRCGFTDSTPERGILPNGWAHGDFSRWPGIRTPLDLCPRCFVDYQDWFCAPWDERAREVLG